MILMLLALQAIEIAEPTPEREFMVNTMPRLRGGEITMSFFVDSEGRVLECEEMHKYMGERGARSRVIAKDTDPQAAIWRYSLTGRLRTCEADRNRMVVSAYA